MTSVASEPLSSQKRWIVIYPAYIDKKKTAKQGRKISQILAVENPTSVEIHDVLAAVGFNPLLERTKCYPRDGERDFEVQGRVRVQLKNDDGTAKHEQKTRDEIFKMVAEMIPKLKTRQPGYTAPSVASSSAAAAGKKNKKKK
ncbi:putative signal recognition particle 19 kDa protein [Caenorhabditis elegans]|uniref:Probable signal recognition particle 19 kDa protein n=1 Tax=Caenorhabditis elegans TaxID=6239 RepID=SRP19_CAEEL|nr:putative signal recognition particle 19 kDa protein [Caenorhabditis elegans]O61749.4 RecName: Full=Probable signal recognition particle 19 kDa protein; Short=SRP19 [Caenorhabditis elegans]CCD70777.2 Probable signal recognition particle 19 kDa protein [Caenorhabditis elegans]|eukprot:NP_490855.3 Probable signal recognition particle 19 kDa protein [Caenorhabditis elegans]